MAVPLALTWAQAAAQAATPRVSMSFAPARVTQNTAVHLKVASSGLGRGATVYLQRQFGTAHVFKNVKKLTVRNGATTGPAVSMGHYKYRIVAVRDGSTIARSAIKSLYSYGTLTATQLCVRSQDTYFNGGCGTGTSQVGGNVYQWASHGGAGGNTGPDGTANVVAEGSSCRSAQITFAVSNGDASFDNINSFGSALTQTTADRQMATSSPGNVGSVTYSIRSSAWDLNFWTNTGGDTVYWNGTFSCYTSSGDR